MAKSYKRQREKMVADQLVSRQIQNPKVLDAMRRVPRHLFIAEELWHRAYDDEPLPIGLSQTISQPYMVAAMAQGLELKGPERILEIGTGSGYEAAVLAELCAEVYSIERLEELAINARRVLANLGYQNIFIQVGDGTLGWQEQAPYDGVVISAAAPQIPRPLLEQLKSDGILVLPMGEKELQSLVRIRKAKDGLKEEYLGECRFVKLKGAYGWED